MSTELLIASSLRLAKIGIDDARILLQHGSRNAAYFAEQALEHVILALAQAEEIHYLRNQQHQLDTMNKLLPEENGFKSEISELCWLQAYATAYRYPRTKGTIVAGPSPEKLEPAVASIEALIDRAAEHFGADLDIKSSAPAANSRPPRLPNPSIRG